MPHENPSWITMAIAFRFLPQHLCWKSFLFSTARLCACISRIFVYPFFPLFHFFKWCELNNPNGLGECDNFFLSLAQFLSSSLSSLRLSLQGDALVLAYSQRLEWMNAAHRTIFFFFFPSASKIPFAVSERIRAYAAQLFLEIFLFRPAHTIKFN